MGSEGSDRTGYCADSGSSNPNYPVPNPDATNNLYETFKTCLEDEPVLRNSIQRSDFEYSSESYGYPRYKYQQDIWAMFMSTYIGSGKYWSYEYLSNLGMFYTHDDMCMSDDPTKIEKYLECYNYTQFEYYSFHDEYMKCIRLMNISSFQKQSLACNKGYVFFGLDNIHDTRMRQELSQCLNSTNNELFVAIGCSNSTDIVENRESLAYVDTKFLIVQPCFDQIFNLNGKYIYETLKKESYLAKNVCEYRSENLEKYNISIMTPAKMAGKCFVHGPEGNDGKIKECYKKNSKLLTKYDIDFLLCVVPDEYINKVRI